MSMKVSVSHPLDTTNFTAVNLSGYATLYYSYETVIAFRAAGELVIRENAWSVTTGKHLNYIDPDKTKRIDKAEFEQKLDALLSRLQVKESE